MNETAHLAVRLLNDFPPDKIEALYGVSQSGGGDDSVLLGVPAAYKAISVFRNPRVLLCGESAANGYTGFGAWRAAVLTHIPDVSIEPVMGGKRYPDGDRRGFNTSTELEALILHAKREDLRSIGIVAPAVHLVRAYVTAVTFALRHYPELDVFGIPGTWLPWGIPAKHSQGEGRKIRDEFVDEELAKLERYEELATTADVLAYMRVRDQRRGI